MLKPQLKQVPVSALIVDPDLQRGQDPRRVAKIETEFDEGALGVITVSQRANGAMHVVDGQHRVAAARLARGDDFKMTARVFVGLSTEEEARLFRLLNNTAKPSAVDLFRIRVLEGDPVAVEIDRILAKHGWRIMLQTADGFFAATASAERVYRADPTAVEHAISAVTRAWGKDRAAVDGRVFEGIGMLFARYGDLIDQQELVDRLSRSGTPGQLIGKARGLRELIGGTLTSALAEIVVEMYNSRRRTRALPAWRTK